MVLLFSRDTRVSHESFGMPPSFSTLPHCLDGSLIARGNIRTKVRKWSYDKPKAAEEKKVGRVY